MQRVAIGRALVRKPSIYLMDEPLSSLDAKLRGDLRLELKRIQAELGATMLYVTHDQIEAMTMADRIGVLAEGRLVQIGTPREIYDEPANLHVAARLGQPAINLLPRRPAARRPRAGGHQDDRRAHRASDASQKAANGHADGTVDWIEHLGDQNHLHVTVGEPQAGDADRSGHAARTAATAVTIALRRAALFRRRRQPDRGVMEAA